MEQTSNLESVRRFWEKTPCGEHFVDELEEGSPEYFRRITEERYKWEYHLPPFLDEVAKAGKSVLEIGCGMGIDSSELARRGCQVTGVDLTERAITLAQKNFARLRLEGTFKVDNAEALSFADNAFEVVYSCGVLHHTPDTVKSIKEVYRVLKPGGRAFIMLYSRYSLNRLAHLILKAPYEKSKDSNGSDAPITRVYSKKGLEVLFSDFTATNYQKRYLFGAGWKPVVYFVPTWMNGLLGRVMGWHWMITAKKPG